MFVNSLVCDSVKKIKTKPNLFTSDYLQKANNNKKNKQ